MYMYVNGVCTSFMYVYTPTMYRRGVSFQVAPTSTAILFHLVSTVDRACKAVGQ